MSDPVCAIVGVGAGNGAAFARRFAAEGHRVAVCARSLDYLNELAGSIEGARAYAYDASSTQAAASVFPRIREELGPIRTLIWNAGSGQFGNLDATDPADFEAAWQINARGLFLAAQAVVPDMRAGGSGNLVVIGATASLKGSANFAAFASAKAAQRSLAQSMARQLGPERIHVSLVVIDGVIDIPRTRQMMKDRPDDFFLRPDDIADAVWFLTQQGPQGFSFELDLRPFGERW